MFVPYTPYSELAKKLREAEEKLESLTGYRLKVVERAGAKLEDLLHTNNPWRGKDCGRELCMLCYTKEKTGKLKKQYCKKRSLVYKIWCLECQEIYGEREEKEEILKKIKIHKYIGETSRSVYERTLEHQMAYQTIRPELIYREALAGEA